MLIVPIFQLLYCIVFFMMFLMSVFIIFHVVFYSYSAISKLITLALFISVTSVLLFTNFILFFSIPLNRIFSDILK